MTSITNTLLLILHLNLSWILYLRGLECPMEFTRMHKWSNIPGETQCALEIHYRCFLLGWILPVSMKSIVTSLTSLYMNTIDNGVSDIQKLNAAIDSVNLCTAYNYYPHFTKGGAWPDWGFSKSFLLWRDVHFLYHLIFTRLFWKSILTLLHKAHWSHKHSCTKWYQSLTST